MSWTLALLSPRDFTPYRASAIEPGPTALSLLLCGRNAEYSNFVQRLRQKPQNILPTAPEEIPEEVSSNDAERVLLAVTSRLPYFDTTIEDARAIRELLRYEDLSDDLRCSLALVGSVSFTHNDFLADAVEICRSTRDALRTDSFFRAILDMQLSVRLSLTVSYSDARDAAAEAEGILSGAEETRIVSLERPVVRKIRDGLQRAAADNQRFFATRLGGALEAGEVDDELVFGRFWVEKEAYLEDGANDYLREVFHQQVKEPATVSRSTRIGGGGDKVDRKLSVYHVLCELAGHWKRIVDSAGALGRQRIARGDRDNLARTSTGITLFRRYSHQRSLMDALRIVAARGPVGAIQQEIPLALDSLERAKFNRTNLTMVRFAADLLTEDQCTTAIDVLTSSEWPVSGVDSIGWYRMEEYIIRALSALTRRSKAPGQWLPRMRQQLAEFDALSVQQMTDVLLGVQWSSVNDEESAAWRVWSSTHLEGDTESLALDVLSRQASAGVDNALTEIVESFLQSPRRRVAAALIDLRASMTEYDQERLREPIAALCIEGLARTRREAMQHSYGFGGQDVGVLATAAASMFDSETLWAAVRDFVIDPAVAPSHKSASLEWMAFYIEKIPSSVTDALIQNRDTLEHGSTVDLFGDINDSTSSVFRFMCAAGGISFERSLVDFLQLASDSDVARRIESARSARYVSLRSSPDVVVPVLLKLAGDEAPIVQVSAVRALVHAAVGLEEPLRSLTYRCIERSLQSEGYATAMATLEALSEEVSEGSKEVARNVRHLLQVLMESHHSDRVRTLAERIYSDVSEDQAIEVKR